MSTTTTAKIFPTIVPHPITGRRSAGKFTGRDFSIRGLHAPAYFAL